MYIYIYMDWTAETGVRTTAEPPKWPCLPTFFFLLTWPMDMRMQKGKS